MMKEAIILMVADTICHKLTLYKHYSKVFIAQFFIFLKGEE